MSVVMQSRKVIHFEGRKEDLEELLVSLSKKEAAKFNQVDFDFFLPMPKEVSEVADYYSAWELAIGEYLTNHKVTFMGDDVMGVPVRSFMLDRLNPVDIIDTVFREHTSYEERHPTEKSDENILLRFMKEVAKEENFDSYKKGYEVLKKYGYNGKAGWKQNHHWNYPDFFGTDTLDDMRASLRKKDDMSDTYTMECGLIVLNFTYFGPMVLAMHRKLPSIHISVDFAGKEADAKGYVGTVSFDEKGSLKESLLEPQTQEFKDMFNRLWEGVIPLEYEYEPDW